jgi:hypothetical protein
MITGTLESLLLFVKQPPTDITDSSYIVRETTTKRDSLSIAYHIFKNNSREDELKNIQIGASGWANPHWLECY